LAPGREIGAMPSVDNATDLVNQASSLLARQASWLPSIPQGSASGIPGTASSSSGSGSPGWPPQATGTGFDPDRLRRQAHEMIETLLEAFSPKEQPPGDHAPLLRCAAPVAPGHDGRIAVRVANEEGTPSEVSLYCTNLTADSGYDIPSLRVSISPRSVTIPAKGEATFEVAIAVPQQTPAGIYSGLIQATGAQYVKAVVSVQVT
jgi:hypothetical protein